MVDGYRADVSLNSVDSDPVPVPHFGLALSVDQFHTLSARMKDAKVCMVTLRVGHACLGGREQLALTVEVWQDLKTEPRIQ